MITPSGVVSEFFIPTDYSNPFEITSGPDGNIWFTEYDGNKIGRVNLAAPTPEACSVTTSPGTQTLSVGGTTTISANVSSGLGSATVTAMHFDSYNTAKATASPSEDTDSPFETTVTGVAQGDTAVWATADLSDGRTCQSSGETDTDIKVTKRFQGFAAKLPASVVQLAEQPPRRTHPVGLASRPKQPRSRRGVSATRAEAARSDPEKTSN